MKYCKIGNHLFKDITNQKQIDSIVKHNNYVTFNGNNKSVRSVYSKPSHNKCIAECKIRNEMLDIEDETNGEYRCMYYVIMGYNCNYFSCAYRIYNKDYSELLGIVYHTYANAYVIWFD